MYTILKSECNVFLARDFRFVCDFINKTDKFLFMYANSSTQNFSLIALVANSEIQNK